MLDLSATRYKKWVVNEAERTFIFMSRESRHADGHDRGGTASNLKQRYSCLQENWSSKFQ